MSTDRDSLFLTLYRGTNTSAANLEVFKTDWSATAVSIFAKDEEGHYQIEIFLGDGVKAGSHDLGELHVPKVNFAQYDGVRVPAASGTFTIDEISYPRKSLSGSFKFKLPGTGDGDVVEVDCWEFSITSQD